MIGRLLGRRRFVPPPLIFLTHAKAGSTWVDGILRELYRKAVAPRAYEIPSTFSFERHRVYSAIFWTREEFLRHPELYGIHRFLLIRDVRDAVVSDYFSLRDTHEADPGGKILQMRERLRSLSKEEGLADLIERTRGHHAAIQRSWVGTEIPILKYEDLCRDDVGIFQRLLRGTFGHELSEETVRAAVVKNRFESVFQRPMGVADPASHGRQGTPGDWKNHFTPALRRRFHEAFGDLLIATGYEKDASWAE